jgi:hypothetical protein
MKLKYIGWSDSKLSLQDPNLNARAMHVGFLTEQNRAMFFLFSLAIPHMLHIYVTRLIKMSFTCSVYNFI